jgi:hypothetical protein
VPSRANRGPAGMHAVRSKYFIRRVRIAKNKIDFINVLRAHGIEVEDDVTQANTTVVASFPIKYEKDIKTKDQFSFIEQAQLYLLLQRYWADNSVSCTLEFKPNEKQDLKDFLLSYRESIKGVAVLPVKEYNVYPQLPQEIIDEEKYNKMMEKIKPFNDKNFLSYVEQDEEELDNYCSGEHCVRK